MIMHKSRGRCNRKYCNFCCILVRKKPVRNDASDEPIAYGFTRGNTDSILCNRMTIRSPSGPTGLTFSDT